MVCFVGLARECQVKKPSRPYPIKYYLPDRTAGFVFHLSCSIAGSWAALVLPPDRWAYSSGFSHLTVCTPAVFCLLIFINAKLRAIVWPRLPQALVPTFISLVAIHP